MDAFDPIEPHAFVCHASCGNLKQQGALVLTLCSQNTNAQMPNMALSCRKLCLRANPSNHRRPNQPPNELSQIAFPENDLASWIFTSPTGVKGKQALMQSGNCLMIIGNVIFQHATEPGRLPDRVKRQNQDDFPGMITRQINISA